MTQPRLQRSEARATFFSHKTSGDTYWAVPTKLERRSRAGVIGVTISIRVGTFIQIEKFKQKSLDMYLQTELFSLLSKIFADPKSEIFMCILSSRSIFSGFRSLK